MISYRLDKLRSYCDEQKVNVVLISKPANLQYFSGFTGDSTVLIISRKRQILITDNRYVEQAKSQSPNFDLIVQEDGLWKKVSEVLSEVGLNSIGIEGNFLTVNEFNKLKELLPKLNLTALKFDELRQVKDESEIEKIQRACDIADKAFEETLKFIHPGVTEMAVAAQLENVMRQLGSEKAAFDTIVASGLRGCLPHGTASEKIIRSGEFVTMDFGATFKGYHSDMTRTVFVGRADVLQRRIYNALLEAQILALPLIKDGADPKAVDEAVRIQLQKDGFAQFFTHGLGHGVGLEIHEEPRLSKNTTSKVLKTNMIVTDEPGLYIPNFGGLRIEDTVVVAEGGAILLTHSDKRLIEIV